MKLSRGLSSGSFREPVGQTGSSASNRNSSSIHSVGSSPNMTSQASVAECEEEEDDSEDVSENWHIEERVSAKASAKPGLIGKFAGQVSKLFRYGGGSRASKFGDHACVKVAMKLHYSPLGEAVTGLVWPEEAFLEVPSKFDIERTLTEVRLGYNRRKHLWWTYSAPASALRFI